MECIKCSDYIYEHIVLYTVAAIINVEFDALLSKKVHIHGYSTKTMAQI
jgi:hypothetical protein